MDLHTHRVSLDLSLPTVPAACEGGVKEELWAGARGAPGECGGHWLTLRTALWNRVGRLEGLSNQIHLLGQEM